MLDQTTILDEIVEFEGYGYSNPYNGKEWFEIRWSGVTFKRDFGPWKEGYKAYQLTFCPITGVLSESGQDELIRSCQLELRAANQIINLD